MASAERPTYTQPVPPGADVRTQGGERYACWTDRTGKAVRALILPSGKCRRTVPHRWVGVYRDHRGVKCKTPTFGDRAAALRAALDAERQAEAVREGRAAPGRAGGKELLRDQVAAYLAHLEVRGVSAAHRAEVAADLPRLIAGAGLTTAAAVDAGAVDLWLERERRTGARRATRHPRPLSLRTRNKWAKKLKAFGAWLDATGRAAANPFRRLTVANEAADPRHVRRAIPAAELLALLAAARGSTRVYRGLSGPDRAALYLAAAWTGLRADSLRALTPESFAAAGGVATAVTARAETTKGLKAHTVPLPADAGAWLGRWLAGKAPGRPVWAMTSYCDGDLAKVLRADLKAAGIPYRDATGAAFDFHALRGQCATLLVEAGVPPAVIQRILDHSDPRLTARYTRLSDRALADGVAKLPSLGPLGPPLGSEVGGPRRNGPPKRGRGAGRETKKPRETS